jgi:hypothetical protein
MDIDELAERFTAIAGARLGRGPRHPRQPDSALAEHINRFLDEYPFLRTDPGYVEFLEKYAGAYAENEDVSTIVDILGFSEVSTEMIEMEGPIINKEGYLIFAQCIYHIRDNGRLRDTQEHDFAFDATGDRKPGVYRLFSAFSQLGNEFEWQYPGFTEWFADLVSHDGALEPRVSG